MGDTVKFYSVQRLGEDLDTHLLSSASLPLVTVCRLILHYTNHCHSLCPYSPNEFKDTGNVYNSIFQDPYLYLLLSTGTMSIAI